MKVMVTGGCGFLGSEVVRVLLRDGHEVVSFDNSEYGHEKQSREHVGNAKLVSYVGDVTDEEAVEDGAKGCHGVVHCAALKHVHWAQEQPLAAIKVNVLGTQVVARRFQGENAVLVSTDKAVKPVSTYGATKMLGECLWKGPIARLGNIFGSTGSVLEWIRSQDKGVVEITSKKMRRFHLRLDQAAKFVVGLLGRNPNTYVAPMRWYWLSELVHAIHPGCEIKETGLRAGEKYEEELGSVTMYHLNDKLTIKELQELCGCTEPAATAAS